MKVIHSPLRRIAIVLSLLVLGFQRLDAQEEAAKEHAKRVLELLRQEQFDEVAKEFNAQVAAAMSTDRLKEAWTMVKAQAGDFKSIIDQRVQMVQGVTAVISGCQFEKGPLNVILSFDSDDKIAGLRFLPRAPGNEQSSAAPSSNRFKEHAVTVGDGKWSLPGTLSMPLEGTSIPAVVLVHGSGPADRDETVGLNKPFRDLAWGLADRGIAVLR